MRSISSRTRGSVTTKLLRYRRRDAVRDGAIGSPTPVPRERCCSRNAPAVPVARTLP
jgi:hypothetical protein